MIILYLIIVVGAFCGLCHLLSKILDQRISVYKERCKILCRISDDIKETEKSLAKEVKDLENLIRSQKPRWFNEDEDKWRPGCEPLEARMERLWREAYNAENDL